MVPKAGTAVFTFGRMNPPHVGHAALVAKVIEEAQAVGGQPFVFLSHTQDKTRNPLPYRRKFEWVREAFGDVVVDSSATNVIEILKRLSETHDAVVMITGELEKPAFDSMMQSATRADVEFKSATVKSRGPRGDTVSATDMRKFAKSGDRVSFTKNLPEGLKNKSAVIFDEVRRRIGG